MKISCEIIRDVLPLYAEDISSKDTRLMVDEHLESCPDCRKELEEMKTRTVENFHVDRDARLLKRLKNTLFKNKVKTIIFTVILTLLITITAITIANLTTPNYIPYSKDVVDIFMESDGTVIAEFSKEVSNYDLERYQVENESGYVFHITAWNTFWSRNIAHSSQRSVVLNPKGERVSAVYYYQTDGSTDDVLIYGKNQVPDGGIVTLPRLVLGYYLMLALLSCILFALLLLIFYRNEKAKYWLVRIVAVPISYMIGHILIRGSVSSTYTALRDFIAILAIAIPLYIVFLLVMTLIDRNKRKNEKA